MRRRGRLRERVLCARPGVGSRLRWRPGWLRSDVVRRLSAELLVQAIGNTESRDDLFWLRRQAWELAHRILGVDDGDDRFKETGWRLAFESDVAGAIYMPLVDRYYRMRRSEFREPLDRLLDERWAECWDRYVWSVQAASRQARVAYHLDRCWRGGRHGGPMGNVLGDLNSALPRGRAGIGVIVARPGFLQSGEYEPVLAGLRRRGVAVLWVEVADGPGASDDDGPVAVAEHAWGTAVSMHLPSPEEVARARAAATGEYAQAVSQVQRGCAALPHEWRWLARVVDPVLPLTAHRWMAATAMADTVLQGTTVRFVHVQADKDAVSRAFILAARARGIQSSYYYAATELGAPSYWPLADRVLVTNAARLERLAEELGVSAHRIEVVGSLEIDRIIHALHGGGRDAARGDRVTVLLLTKWPAPLFFGDAQRLETLMVETARWAPGWYWIIKPHPRDVTDYARLVQAHPGRVEVRRDGYTELMAGARLVVSAMGNSVFHAIAAGKPLVVFNPDRRIELGQDRLFARPDLPAAVKLTQTWPDLLDTLRGFASADRMLEPYTVAPSLTSHLFYSLDLGTADRIVASLLER